MALQVMLLLESLLQEVHANVVWCQAVGTLIVAKNSIEWALQVSDSMLDKLKVWNHR